MSARTSARRTRRIVAALASALFVLLLLPANALADDTPNPGTGTVKNAKGEVSWGVGPANHVPPKQVVDGRAYLVYDANPGATILDQIKLFNYGVKPLTLQVYPTDAVQSTDGAFGLLPGGETPADAGSWITLTDVPRSGKVTVPGRVGTKAYGTRLVKFIAHIPAKAVPGDHVGGIVASLKVTGRNKKGAKITLDQRVGVRAYFSLSGTLSPKVTIEHLTASYKNTWDPLGRGLYTVSYTVHNTGNLRLDVGQDVRVNRCIVPKVLCPSSDLVAHPTQLRDLLPGSRVVVTQTFKDRFGLGRPSADVTLHPTVVDAGYKKVVPAVTASVGFWALPWLLILIILAVLLLGGGGGYLYYRRRKKQKEWIASAPAPRHAASDRKETIGSSRRWLRPARVGAAMAVASMLVAPAALLNPADAKAPKGSTAEVILETRNVTGQPWNANLSGWWGHEGGKNDTGRRPTYLSLDASDGHGIVDDATTKALHRALDDGGTFDSLRVAFVPYSADGSNERPHVAKGENAGQAFKWFADLGFGSALNGTTNKNDGVNWVSTLDEYSKWWKAGRPVQGFTNTLKVLDIAGDGSTRISPTPEGASILDRWPAGTKISLVFYVSDGVDKAMPQIPTVKVGPDGRALTSWLTFETVASPTNPARTSGGYRVLTGAGTGPGVAARPKAASSARASGGATPGTKASPSSQGAAGADKSGEHRDDSGLMSALPGGRPTFFALLAAVLLGLGVLVATRLRAGDRLRSPGS